MSSENLINPNQFESLVSLMKSKGRLGATIVSDSMEPVIKNGEKIEIERIEDFSSLKKFDILVYWNGYILVCHYLVRCYHDVQGNVEDQYVTRGIKNTDEDPLLPRSRILGKVAKTLSWQRRFREVWKMGWTKR